MIYEILILLVDDDGGKHEAIPTTEKGDSLDFPSIAAACEYAIKAIPTVVQVAGMQAVGIRVLELSPRTADPEPTPNPEPPQWVDPQHRRNPRRRF